MTRRRSPALVFATRSGGTTIDRDAFGGNPFATALIQVAGEHSIPFRRFPGRLRALTVQGSQRHQVPQWTRWPEGLRWSFRLEPGSRQERRCALVLIVSDYAGAGLAPLAGAAHDERRISAMLGANGFSVVQGVAPDRAVSHWKRWRSFGRAAAGHDVAHHLLDGPRSRIERQCLPAAGRLPPQGRLFIGAVTGERCFDRSNRGRVSRVRAEPGFLRGLPHACVADDRELLGRTECREWPPR